MLVPGRSGGCEGGGMRGGGGGVGGGGGGRAGGEKAPGGSGEGEGGGGEGEGGGEGAGEMAPASSTVMCSASARSHTPEKSCLRKDDQGGGGHKMRRDQGW
jgi:hypothetical protein